MKAYGRSSISDLLGDRIVYRNLVPADGQLPPLDALREQADLPAGVIPRKSELAYGRVIALLLQAAQSRRLPGVPIQRLIYVGDTRMNDGIAFANVARAGGWPGLAFIAAETAEPARVELAERDGQTLYLANRWAALADFEAYGRDRGFPADERTAVVVDLDKTLLGARGRNDQVIDRARVQAVRLTVAELLGDEFDPRGFQAAYDLLNQQAFHPFTADNQDYLAYICLMLGGGLFRLEPLVEEVRAGRMESFAQFIAAVDGRRAELPPRLRDLHQSVYGFVQRGDPTPFKAFRYNEFRVTVGAMGWMPDTASAGELLAGEIVITQEVREKALAWRERGALLFALSDKPDEASIPSDELARQGFRPIHRAETHVVGG